MKPTGDWTTLGIVVGALLVLGMFDKTRTLAIGLAIGIAVIIASKKLGVLGASNISLSNGGTVV